MDRDTTARVHNTKDCIPGGLASAKVYVHGLASAFAWAISEVVLGLKRLVATSLEPYLP